MKHKTIRDLTAYAFALLDAARAAGVSVEHTYPVDADGIVVKLAANGGFLYIDAVEYGQYSTTRDLLLSITIYKCIVTYDERVEQILNDGYKMVAEAAAAK